MVRSEDVRLSEFAKASIAELMPLADRRNIDVGLAVSVDAVVSARRDELSSLLHNLLDNALRYTPTGGIVDVVLRAADEKVVLEVIDSGPGIPEDKLLRVFDRFYRIEGTDTEGSGLGLAIARNAAERNQIDVVLLNRSDAAGLIARVTLLNTRCVGTQSPALLSAADQSLAVPAD
jgi:signal transduction histidine kinase